MYRYANIYIYKDIDVAMYVIHIVHIYIYIDMMYVNK